MNQQRARSQVAGRVIEFDRAHGDGILREGWMYFADGARRQSNGLLGELQEPPSDKAERALNVRAYRKAIADRAAGDYRIAKTAKDKPPVKTLEFLRRRASDARVQLTKAEAELAANNFIWRKL